MSIYSEVIEINQILADMIDPATGEIAEGYDEAENTKKELLAFGLEKWCKTLRNIQNDIEGLKAEKKRIEGKIKALEGQEKFAEGYIHKLYLETGEEKALAGSFTVSTRKSEQVVLTEGFENKDYGKYEFKADKVAIKDALKNGVEIEGASLQTNYNLQVR